MAFDGALLNDNLEAKEAEKVILGAILLDNSLIAQTRNLTVLDFVAPFHRAVFSAMLELAEDGEKIDPILIFDILKRENLHDKNSWFVPSITNLTFGLPHFSGIGTYTAIVKDASLRRQKILELNKLAEGLASKKLSIKDFASKLGTMESELRQDNPSETNSFKTLAQIFGEEVVPVLDDYFKSDSSRYLVSTGFPEMDMKLGGGLYLSDFLAIVAPPKSAKSALALQMARLMAKNGETVALLSLEMSNLQNCLRLIAQESAASSLKIDGTFDSAIAANWIRPGMSDRVYKHASEIASTLFFQNFFINQNPLTWKDLQLEVRRLKKEHDLRVLFVDYWQLVKNSNPKLTTADSLKEIAQGLKQLAQELNIVIITLGQFNQEGLKKHKNGEELSPIYLEGSGELLKSANIVLTVDIKEAELNSDTDGRFGTLTFKPLRSGADARLDCVFVGKYLTVEIV